MIEYNLSRLNLLGWLSVFPYCAQRGASFLS